MRCLKYLLSVPLAATLLPCAYAQTSNWLYPATGTLQTTANWSNGVPGAVSNNVASARVPPCHKVRYWWGSGNVFYQLPRR